MMMQEILKPLLENDVLTDEVKSSIENALMEAIKAKEEALRNELEKETKEKFEAAKLKFEETYKKLEESYKNKLSEAETIIDSTKNEIEELKSKIEELESRPFVNVTEEDIEAAEAKLVEELETKYEKAFDLAKEKFNNTFEIIVESNSDIISGLEAQLKSQKKFIEKLENKIEELINILQVKEEELSEALEENAKVEEKIAEAIADTEERVRAETEEKIETIKENLVTSTEIFLEQELAEIKAQKEEIMKEAYGRELLENIKELVKQYWDIDSEVANEILELKRNTELKVEQYKEMLKREHSRLEEAQEEIEKLKKKLIVESKSSILSSDKKEALEKLAENMDVEKLETNIDKLMESVIDAFNSGYSKKDIIDSVDEEIAKAAKQDEIILESTRTAISSGDLAKKTSDELDELLTFAGVKK